MENMNEHNYNYDILTGLPLRRSYWIKVDQYMEENPGFYCMVSTEIEHFSFFNKWYGHEKGDQLLKRIGKFLQELDKETGSMSGYLGGDDFSIFFATNQELADRVYREISDIVASVEKTEEFKTYFGGYLSTHNKVAAMEMYDYTRSAINMAMENKDTTIFWFDDQMAENFIKEMELMPKVHEAMLQNEFTFFLQPKCLLHSGKIVGSEALVRWISPSDGLISPIKFVPAMEKNGFITQLDRYIWEEVCKTIRRWIVEGRNLLPISVNVSRIDIYSMDIVEVFSGLVKKYDIPVSLLELEITESAYVENEAIIKDAEEALKNYGFKILIDDFGSGYSSLNMLKDVDADVLKLDMKFLNLNEENELKGINIIGSVLNMAHQMDLPTIAEGIETQAQVDILDSMGCEYAQGYFYYRPLPINEFEILVSKPENIAKSDMQRRKLSKSYLQELTEYFWKVAEVNPITGEYHFIRKSWEPDFMTSPRPRTIQEYIERYIKNGIVHKNDVNKYAYMSDLLTVQNQIKMEWHRRRTNVRFLVNGDYRWYNFEIIVPRDYNEESPWVLFSWKEGDADAGLNEDTLFLVKTAFRTIIKINLSSGSSEIIKAYSSILNSPMFSTNIIEWSNRFADMIHPADRVKYYQFIDVDRVINYFMSGGDRLRITVRHMDETSNTYIWVIMSLERSIEFTEEKPIIMFTARDVDLSYQDKLD